MYVAGVDQPQQHLGIYRRIAFAIPGSILQQRDGVRYVGGASLTVDQHPREDDLSGFTAGLDGFFRQLAGLRIVRLLGVKDFELRQQRQRIAIGRALILRPKLIVCDEPVSALDVSIQAQILNLMMDLQEKYRLTYIFVTHDLSVVKHISDDIMVMYLGVMVEKTSSEELFSRQLHPYTKALLSAIPIAKPNLDRKRIALKGELTSPIEPPKMCRFAPRCPYATERCFQEEPALEEVLPRHFVSCHRVKEINQL